MDPECNFFKRQTLKTTKSNQNINKIKTIPKIQMVPNQTNDTVPCEATVKTR